MNILPISDFFESTSDKFSVIYSDPESYCDEHSHEFDELVFVEGGHGMHTINGESDPICQGDVLYIKRGWIHSYQDLGCLKLTNLLINSLSDFNFITNVNFFTSKIETAACRKENWVSQEHLKNCKDIICNLNVRNEYCDKMMSSAAEETVFLQLLMTLSSSMSQKSIKCSNGRVQQAIQWLHENCHDEVDIKQLCDRFLLSERTFYRHIRENTGLTPYKFITKLRLMSARKKIRTTNQSITEISFLCGFTDSNHFSTRYKEQFGLSPSQERALKVGIRIMETE